MSSILNVQNKLRVSDLPELKIPTKLDFHTRCVTDINTAFNSTFAEGFNQTRKPILQRHGQVIQARNLIRKIRMLSIQVSHSHGSSMNRLHHIEKLGPNRTSRVSQKSGSKSSDKEIKEQTLDIDTNSNSEKSHKDLVIQNRLVVKHMVIKKPNKRFIYHLKDDKYRERIQRILMAPHCLSPRRAVPKSIQIRNSVLQRQPPAALDPPSFGQDRIQVVILDHLNNERKSRYN